jgi:hypothetical protein
MHVESVIQLLHEVLKLHQFGESLLTSIRCCCPAVGPAACPAVRPAVHPVAPHSKVVRKSIARVHTVYRANIRSALRSKINGDGENRKGRVSVGQRGACGGFGVLGRFLGVLLGYGVSHNPRLVWLQMGPAGGQQLVVRQRRGVGGAPARDYQGEAHGQGEGGGECECGSTGGFCKSAHRGGDSRTGRASGDRGSLADWQNLADAGWAAFAAARVARKGQRLF